MGGTFDPIHFGHLFIAEESRVRCELAEVIFIPNRQPAHKEGKSAYAEAETRYEMTRLAIEDNPHFRISRVELDRPGPSFAFDTLQHFHHQYGSALELFFIVGADSMLDVLTWYRGSELFDWCRFIAATRPGYDLEKARAQLSPAQQECVEWLEVPGLYIASRDLRNRVAEERPIRYLVPDAVERVIKERGLYRSED